MPRDPEILNIHEAATFLGSHEQTVRRLARRRGIPCFKVGRDWRFHRGALDEWTRQHSRNGQSTVLVVDDEPEVCAAMSEILAEAGHRALCATDPLAALKMIGHMPVDLVILDLKMPGMSGPQFLARLRPTHPELPVIIHTGYPDSELMQEASLHGPLLLLPKPAQLALIERTVRMALRQSTPSRRQGG